ncbi:FxsA family protein [Nocardioides sp. NPDC057772]|uniref:FxsA family protein n=1 Tax=Nocardioides sp. NPDC057772 TaxID=3346245 RepID=UPI00366F6D81
MTTTRRRRFSWVLVLLFLVMPLAELFVLIQVGQVIGVWWTILLLIADSIFGAWLMRREGSRAWNALTTALSSGKLPSNEIADGALILLGGALMLSPGFVTDIFGIVLILPFTRPLFRRMLATLVQKRLVTATMPSTFGPGARPRNDDIVTGEVIDKDNIA